MPELSWAMLDALVVGGYAASRSAAVARALGTAYLAEHGTTAPWEVVSKKST